MLTGTEICHNFISISTDIMYHTCTSAQGYVMAIYQKQFCMNKYQRMSLDPRTV